MARPREFDSGEAVMNAMNVFWDHGYDGASISILLDGMGLTKGSLYKAFTDKKTLFLTTMELYEAEQVLPAIEVLNDAAIEKGRDRIAKMFRSIPSSARAGDRRGCMLCSAAAGPASHDEDIAGIVNGLLADLRDGFEVALADLPAEARRNFASLLVSQYVGLRILTRAQVSVDELERSVEAVIGMVD